MLKALVTLLSRLRRAFLGAVRLLTAVLRGFMGGGPAVVMPPVECVEDDAVETAATAPSAGHEAQRQAVILRQAAEALLRGAPPGPGPVELPNHLRRWLDGLDRPALAILAKTPVLLLARHLRSRHQVAGLPCLSVGASEVREIEPPVPARQADAPHTGLRLNDLLSDRQALQDRIRRKMLRGAPKPPRLLPDP